MSPRTRLSSPTCAGKPDARVLGILKDAYTLAPAEVQAALCHLNSIFGTNDASYSDPARQTFGVWEAPGRGRGEAFLVVSEETLKERHIARR
jgi:hypothetical protein